MIARLQDVIGQAGSAQMEAACPYQHLALAGQPKTTRDSQWRLVKSLDILVAASGGGTTGFTPARSHQRPPTLLEVAGQWACGF